MTDDRRIELQWLQGRYAIARLEPTAPLPDWVQHETPLLSLTRTADELSIITIDEAVPLEVAAERGWVAMRVVGPLAFTMVGILAELSGKLAEAEIPLLAVSTYETDVLLVKAEHAWRAAEVLGISDSVPQDK